MKTIEDLLERLDTIARDVSDYGVYLEELKKTIQEFIVENYVLKASEPEFTYPMWFEGTGTSIIVKFTNLEIGSRFTERKLNPKTIWTPHTHTDVWTQIEDPTIVKAPKTERRWIWLKDEYGCTIRTDYISDWYAKDEYLTTDGWHKSEMFIDVEVKE